MKAIVRSALTASLLGFFLALAASEVRADDLPVVGGVELQPLAAHVERVKQALELAGSPLSSEQQKSLDAALATGDAKAAVAAIQKVLDPLCVAGVNINPESRVKVKVGTAAKKLIEQGWRTFLVKVQNEAGVTAALRCSSPNAATLHDTTNSPESPQKISPMTAFLPPISAATIRSGIDADASWIFRPTS